MEGRSRKMEADNYHKRMVVGAAGMAAFYQACPGTALVPLCFHCR
ncbi:hypothetical protein AALA46_24955 [Enterocloster aldenensis]